MKQLIDDLEALATAADHLGLTGMARTCRTRAAMLRDHLREVERLRGMYDGMMFSYRANDIPTAINTGAQIRRQIDKVTEVLR